ncbi:lamin tail domain-containing protein [Leptospira sp. FAT2]|uniref:lamin tail domain-containing protein n=1 Tax=Leptospira sanjuanensis TaxID=2879643 RepID=UPI001EE94EED|nr:lamin tail domain-containing protein [Leptospira sanjuanensis]MCG6193350.1 lamin tail domain-containing protein [Leptospira sanjuanensis]
MKFKSVFVSILCFAVFEFCHGKGKDAWIVPILRPGEWKLFYEPENTISSEIPREISKQWRHPSVRIQKVPGIVCLFSGTVSVYGVSVCFPDPQGNIELEFQNILKFWNTHFDSRTEQTVFDFSEKGQAKVSVRLNQDLLEEITEDWMILSGFQWIDRELKKRKFPKSNWVSVFSENSIARPHTPNLISGFSVWAGQEKIRILFSAENFTDSANTLVIEIPGNTSILSEFLSEIASSNREMVLRCKEKLPVLSEVFGGTESSLGRFLEFANLENEPICFSDLTIETSSKKNPILSGSSFLMPNETLLFTETGSNLPGLELVSFPWSDLKKKGNWSLQSGNLSDVFENPERTFLEGGRYYSSKRNFYSLCENFFQSNQWERYCMSPGFENPGSFNEPEVAGNEIPFCDAASFQIEEANWTGVFTGGTVDSNQKFLDLEYSGNRICNPNGLSVESDGREIPIWIDSRSIKPGEILTIGNRDFMKGEVLLSSSVLKEFEFGFELLLKDRKNRTNRILSETSFQTPVLKRTDGTIVSLLYRNGIWIPHPKTNSQTLNSQIQNSHFMNPGIKTDPLDMTPPNQAVVSEISWMGSYDGTTSVSADRFIEVDSDTNVSKVLEVESGTKNYRFLVELVPGKNVFSIGRLVCFPDVSVWIVPELNLANTGRVRLLSLDATVSSDWIEWDSLGKMGIHSSSQKLRRSASLFRTISGKEVWKNSALTVLSSRKAGCSGTEASPGLENRTFPFFQREDFATDNSILNPWISWNPGVAGLISGEFDWITIQPSAGARVAASEFLRFWRDLRENGLGSFAVNYETLNYLVSAGAESLILIPGSSGVLISTVYPNPTVSSNEWFSICNQGAESVDIRSLEIRDSSASDRLVEYSFRFGSTLPAGWNEFNPNTTGWSFGDRFLHPGECGYVLSPNFKNESVPFHSETFRKIFTIDKTTTIGNGIGKNEGLDLFQDVSGKSVHIHSYGNQFSPLPFSIDANANDLILLKTGRTGDSASDYEIKKKESL